jgi:hypothetical protein
MAHSRKHCLRSQHKHARNARRVACVVLCEACGYTVGRRYSNALYVCLCRACWDDLTAVTKQPIPSLASQEKGDQRSWT